MLGKKKKRFTISIDLEGFIVRFTEKRVDIEARSGIWKTCFFHPSKQYHFWMWLLVPDAFPNDPSAVARAASQEEYNKGKEDAHALAEVLYFTTCSIIDYPQSSNKVLAVFEEYIKQHAPESELTKEQDDLILAEERAMADPTEENIEAVREARVKAEESVKKPKPEPGKRKKKKNE